MLKPIQLQTLAAVVRTGSFADAGRELGYTASAVSQQVAALERALCLQLFEREPRRVRPTSAALLFAERGARVLDVLQELEDDARAMAQGRAGRLRIGTFPSAGGRLLPRALAVFSTTQPGAEILLDEAEPEQLLDDVGIGLLDVALAYEYTVVPRTWPTDLSRRHLLEEDLLLLTPSNHVGDTTLEKLAQHAWIGSLDGDAGGAALRLACAQAGFEPKVALRANDYAVVRNLVAAGLGVGLIPALGWNSDSGVVARALTELNARRRVVALYRPGNRNPLLHPALRSLEAAARAGGFGLHVPRG